MYGAILGDIVGSRFEFDRGPWKKNFRFITKESSYTDDTVMTVAIAEALIAAGKDADVSVIKKECIKSMKKWGKKYPYAGYGRKFFSWVLGDDEEPYNSLGNGSAMRVSAAGWMYDTIERTREVARATAEVTHNHPEGIKGAECTAAVIFMARNEEDKGAIREYVLREFGYDTTLTLDELRMVHRHDETCMDALPKALVSFFEGRSYEDTVRNAVSLGGDTDTIAAIAGSMAEAFYGMPEDKVALCRNHMEDDMVKVADSFDNYLNRKLLSEYASNAVISEAITLMKTAESKEEMKKGQKKFTYHILKRMLEDAIVPMPYNDINNVFADSIDPDNIKVGSVFALKEEAHLKMDEMVGPDGKHWVPLFLNEAEMEKGKTGNIIIPLKMSEVFEYCEKSEDVEGIVINPFSQVITIKKKYVPLFLSTFRQWKAAGKIMGHSETK